MGSDTVYLFNLFNWSSVDVKTYSHIMHLWISLHSSPTSSITSKTGMIQLNLSGAIGLKNTCVLTSSRKKRTHITSKCPVRQKIGNRRLIPVRHWRIHLGGKEQCKPPGCKKTFRVFTVFKQLNQQIIITWKTDFFFFLVD